MNFQTRKYLWAKRI